MATDLRLDPDAVLWSAPPAERDGRPLLVVMHGRGSDERDLFSLAPELPAEYAIASVRAPFAEGAGWAWFEAADNPPADPTTANADRAAAAVLAFLDALPFRPSAVGALGFSQGGAMATHLLRRDPARIRFAVNLAGFLVGGEQAGDAVLATTRPPVFWGRGAVDPLFSPELVTRTEPWLRSHTAPVIRVYPGLAHAVSREELDDVVAFLRARPAQ